MIVIAEKKRKKIFICLMGNSLENNSENGYFYFLPAFPEVPRISQNAVLLMTGDFQNTYFPCF